MPSDGILVLVGTPGRSQRFGVLGPLEVRDGERSVPIVGAQQRIVLAVLLLNANRAVSADRLVESLWGDRPPSTARRLLHGCVARLRGALRGGPAAGQPLQARPPGYLLRVLPGELDLARFDELVDAAGHTHGSDGLHRAGALLTEALSLWRGPALDGLTGGPAHDLTGGLAVAAAGMEERRLAVLEQRIDLDLRLGRHSWLVGELRTHVGDHPLRERLWAQLMLALAGTDRRADALDAYRRLRAGLVGQLGIEPGPLARHLHQAILSGDDPMAVYLRDAPGPASGGAAPVTTVADRDEAVADPPRTIVVPAQLPLEVYGFTGRDRELAALDTMLDGTDPHPGAVAVSVVSGTAGVGKTALAVRWAHRVADRFPDGQLYVDLRGYDPDHPVSAGDALAGFLRALGVPDRDIPVEPDERAARYRTEIAGRRVLVVADNAATVEQVRPLLPGTPTAVVVVTSRDSLPGLVALHGACRLELDLLAEADALRVLRALVGDRVDAEPDAAVGLVGQCARLPLALRVAAELAVGRPATPLSELVAELADQQRRLDLLDAGGDQRAAVRAVFSWSYRHLCPDAARVFRLAGLHPGPDLDAHAAAALAGIDPDRARDLLGLLARAHLLHGTRGGRYGMHDLLRAYAAGLAVAEPADDADAAAGRLFDHYLAAAAAAMDHLHAAEAHRRPRVPATGGAVPPLADADAALAWLDAERPTLVAVAVHTATHGRPAHAVRLGAILFRYLVGGHYGDALVVHSHARRAAALVGDRAGEANAVHDLGALYLRLGRQDRAARHLRQALLLFREVDDPIGQARALGNLGTAAARLGRYGPAAAHLHRALAQYRRAGDLVGEASVLDNLGAVEERLGRYEAAARRHERALTLFRRAGDLTGEAQALTNLGDVETRLGRHDRAADRHREALALYRRAGDLTGEAWALTGLGTVDTHLGHPDRAAEHHHRALALFREIGDGDGEPWALNGLGEAAHAAGSPGDAIAHHTAALAAARRSGARDQQARAHAGLVAVHSGGDPVLAREHLRGALALYTELAAPEADRVRAHLARAGDGAERGAGAGAGGADGVAVTGSPS